jgi:hypothetical protein
MDKIARNLAAVPRWTITHTIRKQSVAEHCFQTARYVRWLGDQLALPKEVIEEATIMALYHDDFEVVTGDIPSPAKRAGYVTVKKMELPYSAAATALCKLADLAEAYMFCCEEMAMGNLLIAEVRADIVENLIKCVHTDFMEQKTDVMELITKYFGTANFTVAYYEGNLRAPIL